MTITTTMTILLRNDSDHNSQYRTIVVVMTVLGIVLSILQTLIHLIFYKYLLLVVFYLVSFPV